MDSTSKDPPNLIQCWSMKVMKRISFGRRYLHRNKRVIFVLLDISRVTMEIGLSSFLGTHHQHHRTPITKAMSILDSDVNGHSVLPDIQIITRNDMTASITALIATMTINPMLVHCRQLEVVVLDTMVTTILAEVGERSKMV